MHTQKYLVEGISDIEARMTKLSNKILMDLELSILTLTSITHDPITNYITVTFESELNKHDRNTLNNLFMIIFYDAVVGERVYIREVNNENRSCPRSLVPPNANHDIHSGYNVNSFVTLLNGDVYMCTDNTPDAAVWKQISLSASQGPQGFQGNIGTQGHQGIKGETGISGGGIFSASLTTSSSSPYLIYSGNSTAQNISSFPYAGTSVVTPVALRVVMAAENNNPNPTIYLVNPVGPYQTATTPPGLITSIGPLNPPNGIPTTYSVSMTYPENLPTNYTALSLSLFFPASNDRLRIYSFTLE